MTPHLTAHRRCLTGLQPAAAGRACSLGWPGWPIRPWRPAGIGSVAYTGCHTCASPQPYELIAAAWPPLAARPKYLAASATRPALTPLSTNTQLNSKRNIRGCNACVDGRDTDTQRAHTDMRSASIIIVITIVGYAIGQFPTIMQHRSPRTVCRA